MYKYEIDLLNKGIWSQKTCEIYSFFHNEINHLTGIFFIYNKVGLLIKAEIKNNNIDKKNYKNILEKMHKSGLFEYIPYIEIKKNSGEIFLFSKQEIFEKARIYNNLIQEEYKNYRNYCFIDSCKNSVQKCHTISRLYLKNISLKGNVFGYDQNVRIFTNNSVNKIKLKEIGLNEASTKEFYCNAHDKIYTLFECEGGIDRFLDESLLLLYYRVVNSTKYEILKKINIVEKINKKQKYITSEVSNNYDVEKKFVSNLDTNIPEELVSLVIISEKIDISFTGIYFESTINYLYEFLKTGKVTNNKNIEYLESPFFTVNCFSEQNKSYLILSSKDTEHFEKKFLSINKKIKSESLYFMEYFFLFLAVLGGNFYLNPQWVKENKHEDLVDSLLNYLTFGIIRGQCITEFVNFNLINTEKSLCLISPCIKESEIKKVYKIIISDYLSKNIGHK